MVKKLRIYVEDKNVYMIKKIYIEFVIKDKYFINIDIIIEKYLCFDGE